MANHMDLTLKFPMASSGRIPRESAETTLDFC
jgi:hypothetical protein